MRNKSVFLMIKSSQDRPPKVEAHQMNGLAKQLSTIGCGSCDTFDDMTSEREIAVVRYTWLKQW